MLRTLDAGQSSVGLIDDRKRSLARAHVLTLSAQPVPISAPAAWAQIIEEGAGDCPVRSVERESAHEGLDAGVVSTSLAREVLATIKRGANDASRIKAAFEVGTSSILAGVRSMFNGPHRAVLIYTVRDREAAALQQQEL